MDLHSSLSSDHMPVQISLVNGNIIQAVNILYNHYDQYMNSGSDNSFELIENKPVSIIFESRDKDARFYMYGLESLFDDKLEIDDEGEVYLKPSPIPLELYSKDYYPLIPGSYLARAVAEGTEYYIPYKIIPKQITENQLEILKNDLEETVRGLAIDFIKNIYAATDNTMKALPPHLLKQFMIIKKHFSSVMAALSDIYKKANYRIRKDYRWTKDSQIVQIDQITIRNLQTKSFYDGQLKTPYNTIDYDLPENRWVKHIINNVLKLLDQFIDSLKLQQKKVYQEIQELKNFQFQESTRRELLENERVSASLKEYYLFVHKMKIGFQMIIHSPWYSEVSDLPITHVPHTLLYDSRYRSLYQMYRDLNKEDTEIFIDPRFTYQWKRTDKLYEMWGYINIIKLLSNLGFEPRSGWIYSLSHSEDTLMIPFLPSGERIVMTKKDLRIHCIYDGILPIVSSETDLDNTPLYMGKHNRPDCRIDFYKNDVYCGTLIIDFKYRPLSNFWRNSTYNSLSRLREMEQLIAYKRDSNSKYLYGEVEGKAIREMHSPRPVIEVWGLYAEAREDFKNPLHMPDDSLRIITMNPGDNHERILSLLNDTLLFMDRRYESII